jgi:signal transduction histidine kinase
MGNSTVLRRQFVWLVAVLVVVGGAQLAGGLALLARFDGYSRRVDTAQNAHQVMLQAMTDAETGLRGWQLTGEPAYLEPYATGVRAFPVAVREVDGAIRDGRARQLLDAEVAGAGRWLAYAAPLTTARPGPDVPARGKILFDAFRTGHRAAAAALAAGRVQATTEFRAWSSALQAGLFALAVLALLVALRLAVRTHRVMHAQERYLDQVLDVLTVAVVACDADGVIKRMNRAARDGAGDVPLPTHLRELNRVTDRREPDDPGHPLAVALAGSTVKSREMTFDAPDGRPLAVMVDACPLLDERDRIIGAVATRYDVSVLRAREAELTAFAGIVAHDLRSPLAAVAGFIELLELDLRDAGAMDVVGDNLTRLHAGVQRMQQLIDDLLAYATARDAPLRLEPVDLARVVDDVVTERTGHLRHGPGADRPDITAGPLPVLHADPSMIRQMMDNLIGNAIKYTRDDEPAHVRITADEVDPHWARIHIADRGIGIPAAQRESVFTSFHRAHLGQSYAGTGLGLAICRRVADRHGGTITLDDNPAGGTRFHILLPLEPDDP